MTSCICALPSKYSFKKQVHFRIAFLKAYTAKIQKLRGLILLHLIINVSPERN
jgi:hypothetical protein